MIKCPMSQWHTKISRVVTSNILFAHTKTCPVTQQAKLCPGSGGTSSVKQPDFRRAEKSAPCRFGFIPNEWFLFFYSKTGVTGPYIFGIVFINYMLSKEKYVLEHEYYSGLSVAIILYFAVTKFGPAIGAGLDAQVDKVQAMLEQGRQDEINMYENIVQIAKEAQWRAEGQKILVDARKECIAIQLEAAYRMRLMNVYHRVKGMMDYQVKKYVTEKRIEQACMVNWVLENVYESITPEFRKQSLERAIQDLASAGRIKSTLS